MKTFTFAIALALLILVGCSQDVDSTEAVRQGVITHLAGVAGLDLSQMEVEVTAVAFREDEADATISFRPRGATDPAAGMQMSYTLERQGGRWVVRERAEGGSPHGEGMMGSEMPSEEMPPVEMPPDHPPMGEAVPPGEVQ